MPLAHPAAGAFAYGYGNSHAHALADLNAAHLGDVTPYEHADKGADMDSKPNADEHEHSYTDRHGERVTYRHVHIFPAVKHANPDPSANLDADDYRDLDADAGPDAHQQAAEERPLPA